MGRRTIEKTKRRIKRRLTKFVLQALDRLLSSTIGAVERKKRKNGSGAV
jgi:hypothetical protein